MVYGVKGGGPLGMDPPPSAFCTVNLCLVTIKYKNPSCTNKTVPQKYVFDFKEYIFLINTFTFHRLEYIS